MTSSEDKYTLTYILWRESWWFTPDEQDTTALMVCLQAPDGGVKWEFAIAHEAIGALRVKVFDDAWEAFTAIPEFFAGLAALGSGAMLEEVVELLDSIGARDATTRTRS